MRVIIVLIYNIIKLIMIKYFSKKDLENKLFVALLFCIILNILLALCLCFELWRVNGLFLELSLISDQKNALFQEINRQILCIKK